MKRVLIYIMLGLLVVSCKTQKIVTEPQVIIRTEYRTQYERDSVYLHDSVYVQERQKADTIYKTIERWHTRYQSVEVRDTVRDTIPAPYEVVKVERVNYMTQMQTFWLVCGKLAVIALILFLSIQFLKRQYK